MSLPAAPPPELIEKVASVPIHYVDTSRRLRPITDAEHLLTEIWPEFMALAATQHDQEQQHDGITQLEADLTKLQTEAEEYHRLIWKQSQLLTATINILRGPPGELEMWSHHDVAEWAQRLVDERDRLREILQEIQTGG